MPQLPDKPIAITGASSGIGMATALRCAREGMPVALAARRLDRLEKVVAQIKAQGGKAIAVECDVSRPADCERLVDRTIDAFGSLYATFANAGYGVEGSVESSTDFDVRQIFETNFFGTLNTIRPALIHMRASGSGHVLICSSCLSKIGVPYFASYCATKAAQDHYARALRLELTDTRIFVSSVHPIGTKTEFFDQAAARSQNARLALRTPEHLMQSPDRVAAAIVKCLRKPRGEVWTSTPTRIALGLAVMFPGIADRVLRRALRKVGP
jgi:short-subunit dehydrogenase